MTKQVPEKKSTLENKSRNIDRSLQPMWILMALPAVAGIVAVTQVRDQVAFRHGQNRDRSVWELIPWQAPC